MALYVEISRRVHSQTDWGEPGSAEVVRRRQDAEEPSIPAESPRPAPSRPSDSPSSRDEKPHPEEELADQMGTVTVADAEYGYKTVFANPQVPGG